MSYPSKEVSIPVHPHDFEADLRFFSPDEGGRQGPVYQGYRPDLKYEGDAKQLWMIWPVFIADDGAVIPGDVAIHGEVLARMYVVLDEERKRVHCQRLSEGVKFYLHEGSQVVAEGVVTRIAALYQDREAPKVN